MFGLFFRLLILFFELSGYTVAFVFQAVWCAYHKFQPGVGDALGEYVRALTNAFSRFFRQA